MLSPLDLPGPQFLLFYFVSLIAALLLSWQLKKLCRRSANLPFRLPELVPIEMALFAGGRERAIQAALVRLARRGGLAATADGRGFVVNGALPAGSQALEDELYREVRSGKGRAIHLRQLKCAALGPMEERLRKLGLLLPRKSTEARRFRQAATWPLLALIALGAAKLFVGLSRGRPIGLLIVLLVVSFMVLLWAWNSLPWRTVEGDEMLRGQQRRNAALQTTALKRSDGLADADLLLAVALFGTSVLAAGPLAWMHPVFMAKPVGDSGGGGCSSSSSCGGGGCGGGCGGCGG